jgi:hypothetical protein
LDVYGYFDDRQREARELSGALRYFSYAEEEGSGAQRGRLLGRIDLSDRAYVQFHEVVRVEGSGITREKYAYFLVVDEEEIGGYERDPTHDPAVHKHCSAREKHERFESEPVSFKDAVAHAWRYVSDHT